MTLSVRQSPVKSVAARRPSEAWIDGNIEAFQLSLLVMPRRSKTSPAEDFLELVALLPWWGGVAFALVLYAWLHSVAAHPIVAAAAPGEMGAKLTQSMWKALAGVGQYVAPLLFLGGAAVSAWRRRERKALVSNVTRSGASDALSGMGWQEFERLVSEAFRLQGYRVMETGGGGADGGVDLVLMKEGEKFLVQCKQWKAFRVGVDVARELYGVMAAKGAAGGFIVTSGRYTEAAIAFAQGRNLRLIDGPALLGLIRQAQALSSARAAGVARVACSRGRPSYADLPDLRIGDGRANREAGRQSRREVLGLRNLPPMPRDAANRLTRAGRTAPAVRRRSCAHALRRATSAASIDARIDVSSNAHFETGLPCARP